jgi:hypothetical protein
MKLSCTQQNAKNGIKKGSRVSVYTANGTLVDRYEVPSRNGIKYCQDYKKGQYGQKLTLAIEKALFLESNPAAEMAVIVSNALARKVA